MFGAEFRPLDFSSVYGLDITKELLQKTLKKKVYDPAYLFVGGHSTGKTSLGRIFARAVLCENPKEDMSPCNECQSCKSFLENRNTAYLEVDAANSSGKEDVQEILQALKYESISKYKIILFDEAHCLSDHARNALLKQMEEINNNIILILCTTEPEKMHRTLSSRCLQYHLNDPSEEDVLKKLQHICVAKGIEYEPGALHLIVQATGRHFRDAENTLRNVSILGKVTKDSVQRVVAMYVDKVAELLLLVSHELDGALKAAEFLISHMNIRTIYEVILRLLNDSIKVMGNVPFEDEHYADLVKGLYKHYGASLFEILDYILSKNRLNDVTMFQSDVLILYYKFLKGGFEPKELPGNKEAKTTTKTNKESANDAISIHNMPAGEREDTIRQYKMEKLRQAQDDRVQEQVSGKWEPETKDNVSPLIHRRGMSRSEFQKVLKGNLDEERV